ncbi:GlcNAc-transferase family protein [Stenotrophomonas pavanii]|uniref:N-acetylglucosaminyltransferase n=1 Tax=Stenotrophomonas pavanii TaxID=487698 RepID=A0ABN6GLD7_9GAMM|nr:GlcNAc-transferase family protein [Stenotrophomonas pavanii]BCX41985.1 N-acetylglucosaminyltransferase [Stenotrophomonas pavanii]
MSLESIFVQVPSYRDKELIPTLLDLIKNAANPANLRVAVCWQHGDDEVVDDFIGAGFHLSHSVRHDVGVVHCFIKDLASIKVIDLSYLSAKGCGWARYSAQRLYGGERYSLQIDAHHRFVQSWDRDMIEMLESLRARYEKPVLTGYPPSFDPEFYPARRQDFPIKMMFRRFSLRALVSFKASRMTDWDERVMPMRARFLSGGFIFADGSIVTEVTNDPGHFFATEEIIMSVRAYTSGYDFFHPHKVLLWHYYNDKTVRIWDDHRRERSEGREAGIDSTLLAKESYERAISLLEGGGSTDKDFGDFGLGSLRTVRQYERYAGLSFEHRSARSEAIKGTEPDETHFYASDDEWRQGLVYTKVLHVMLNGARLRRLTEEYDGVALIANGDFDSDGARLKLPSDKFNEIVSGEQDYCLVELDVSPFANWRDFHVVATSSGTGSEVVVSDGVSEVHYL